MIKSIIKAAAYGFCLFLLPYHVLAQAPDADTSLSNASKSTVNYFNKAIGQQSRLYNGREYIPYGTYIKSNANFHDRADCVPGSVTFDGYSFNNVPIMYDLYTDELIAIFYNNFSKYIFQSNRVANFDLDDHHFIYILADTTNTEGFKSGFYDEIYSGKSSALVRHSKSMQNRSAGSTELETYFTDDKMSYLVKKGGSYHSVSSESSLLNLLKDHKKELQKYIKTNKIKYKKDPQQALQSIVSYYDHLTP